MNELIAPSNVATTADEHYADLSRLIATVSQHPPHLRTLIYEFARLKLQKEAAKQLGEGSWSGLEQRLRALEVAIDRVESEYPPTFPSKGVEADNPLTIVQLQPISLREVLFGVSRRRSLAPNTTEALSPTAIVDTVNKQLRSHFWWTVQVAAAVLVGVIIYVSVDPSTTLNFLGRHKPAEQAVARPSEDAVVERNAPQAPPRPDFPVPSTYGIYAIADGQLTQLDTLPIKVPDPRIAISALITTPSRAHIDSGKLRFVVFHRDIVADAPERVLIRIVAQIARALSFGPDGKAATTPVQNSWVVRNNAYEMRVGPVPGYPEMVEIKSDDAAFSLPAGRYALAIKNIAYDFTVDGQLTDPAHCLERTDALNTPIYTECPAK
jgi:hypothetical protein